MKRNYLDAWYLIGAADALNTRAFYNSDRTLNCRLDDLKLQGLTAIDLTTLVEELNAAVQPVLSKWCDTLATRAKNGL